MLHIAICDGCAQDRGALTEVILCELNKDACVIRTFADSEGVLHDPEATAFDIIFLDISAENNQGIEAARRINKLLPRAQIIYTTAFLAYTPDIYETRCAYFLVKPVSGERLKSALQRAIERLESEQSAFVSVPLCGRQPRTLTARDILYCERRGRETVIVLTDGECTTKMRIGELETKLPDRQFARPHNSFLVNFARVHEIMRENVVLNGGVRVPISNMRRASFLEAFKKYL